MIPCNLSKSFLEMVYKSLSFDGKDSYSNRADLPYRCTLFKDHQDFVSVTALEFSPTCIDCLMYVLLEKEILAGVHIYGRYCCLISFAIRVFRLCCSIYIVCMNLLHRNRIDAAGSEP